MVSPENKATDEDAVQPKKKDGIIHQLDKRKGMGKKGRAVVRKRATGEKGRR